MIRSVAFVAAAVLAAAAGAQSPAVPKLLLVQHFVAAEDGVDLNVPVRAFFAKEFEDDGRVEPIAWSLNDPAFRRAVESKAITISSESPSSEVAAQVAEKLGCEYVFFVRALTHSDRVYADAQLYRGRRQIWKADVVQQAMVQDQMNLESSARTMARTWIFQLAQGVWKDLKPKPKSQTPDPDPGVKPPPPPPVDPMRTADNAAVKAEYDRLVRGGELKAALRLMWDAVDAEPLNLERRKMLLDVLLLSGQAEEASKQARRAAGLFPEAADLWRMCARAAIESGDYAQAIRDLNEAVTRDPNHPQTRFLLGLAQLMSGRFEFALEHLNASVQAAPSPESHFFRALVHRLMGDGKQSAQDLAAYEAGAASLSSEQRTLLQRSTLRLFVARAEAAGATARTLLQRVRLDPKNETHKRELQGLAAELDGLIALGGKLPDAASASKSRDACLLALNLLSQCISEVQAHLANPGQDILSDATITLGEAFRAIAAAKGALDAGASNEA